ncbi:MAG TPA: DUF4292 domain-containing protein [Flavobacterium sp.]|nr:DUF4292 domain-containing protein [Flavobacterium sp.]
MAFLIVLSGCRSKKGLVEAEAKEQLSAEKIIQNHYKNHKDFSTVYIRANARYKDPKQSHSFTADIRIKKDEKVLVSIRFLGITLAKGLVTPTEVKYYEKSGTYFEGDYSTLSQWLGTDLDFDKVQNMLIGNALYNLNKGKYLSKIEDGLYRLEDKNNTPNKRTFFFEAGNFLLKKQEIEQSYLNRRLQITYPTYKEYEETVLPLTILAEAFQERDKTTISLEYNQVTFNENLSFPYSVPGGYKRIFVEEPD